MSIQRNVWTDSQIALSWLHSGVIVLPVYVRNRVNEIRLYTPIVKLRYYIPAQDSPADFLTRDLSVASLSESKL